jgi:hypothetical protein
VVKESSFRFGATSSCMGNDYSSSHFFFFFAVSSGLVESSASINNNFSSVDGGPFG